jgi:hypothetical protein
MPSKSVLIRMDYLIIQDSTRVENGSPYLLALFEPDTKAAVVRLSIGQQVLHP